MWTPAGKRNPSISISSPSLQRTRNFSKNAPLKHLISPREQSVVPAQRHCWQILHSTFHYVPVYCLVPCTSVGFPPKAKGWERFLSSTRPAPCLEWLPCKQPRISFSSESRSSPPRSTSACPESKFWTKTQTAFCWAGYGTDQHTRRDTTTRSSKTASAAPHRRGCGRRESFSAMKCNGTFCIDLLWNESFLEWLASSSPHFPTPKLRTARNEPR